MSDRCGRLQIFPWSRLNENSSNNNEREKNSVSHFVDTVRVFFYLNRIGGGGGVNPRRIVARVCPPPRVWHRSRSRVGTCLMIGKMRVSLLYCYCVAMLCRCPRINLNFFLRGQKIKPISRINYIMYRTLRGEYALDGVRQKPNRQYSLIIIYSASAK